MGLGYWVVMAMVACALAAVVAALAAEPDQTPADPLPLPTSRPRLTWAALGAADLVEAGAAAGAQRWVDLVVARLPAVIDLRVFADPKATMAETRQTRLPLVLAARPDVASIWLAVNDLLAGTSPAAYETDLDAVLAALAATGCHIVVGNVPDLTRLPRLADDRQAVETIGERVRVWNDEIARVGAARRAALVDLFAGAPDLAAEIAEEPAGFRLSAAGQEQVAALFGPAVELALESAAVAARRI